MGVDERAVGFEGSGVRSDAGALQSEDRTEQANDRPTDSASIAAPTIERPSPAPRPVFGPVRPPSLPPPTEDRGQPPEAVLRALWPVIRSTIARHIGPEHTHTHPQPSSDPVTPIDASGPPPSEGPPQSQPRPQTQPQTTGRPTMFTFDIIFSDPEQTTEGQDGQESRRTDRLRMFAPIPGFVPIALDSFPPGFFPVGFGAHEAERRPDPERARRLIGLLERVDQETLDRLERVQLSTTCAVCMESMVVRLLFSAQDF